MRRIASYSDYRRAAGAAEHLAAEGFDASSVRIVARDLAPRAVRSDHPFWREAGRAVLAATVSAAASVVLLVAVGGVAMAGRYLSFVLVAVGAVVAGFAIAAALHVAEGAAVPHRRLVPGGYDVECGDRADEAERTLARWWARNLDGRPRTPRGYVVRSRGHAGGMAS